MVPENLGLKAAPEGLCKDVSWRDAAPEPTHTCPGEDEEGGSRSRLVDNDEYS